jgi:hypothetical protein
MPTTFTYIADDFVSSGWVAANIAANRERATQTPPLPPRSVQEYFEVVIAPIGESYAKHFETKAEVIADLRKTAPREKLAAIDAEIAKSTAAIQAILDEKAQAAQGIQAQARLGIADVAESEITPTTTPGFFANLRERFKF